MVTEKEALFGGVIDFGESAAIYPAGLPESVLAKAVKHMQDGLPQEEAIVYALSEVFRSVGAVATTNESTEVVA